MDCNRKGDYSILLQAVYDHQKKFIDVFWGKAGSVHDTRMLKKLFLCDRGCNRLLGEHFLLGNSAYPCTQWLIPPYTDNGALSHNQKRFNFKPSSSRIVIELNY